MPSRVIREGLLDSERYWSVSVEAQRFFFHLLLLADDFGLVDLAPVFIRRRAFDVPPDDATLQKLVNELDAADLIRVYEYEGRRYAFIPRFGQKLRTEKAKCPMPPPELFQDDPRAIEKFQKNKDVFKKMPGSGTAVAVQSQRRRPPEVEVEVKKKEVAVEADTKAKGSEATSLGSKPIEQLAEERGIVQRPGESDTAFRQRVILQVLDERR